MDIVVKGRNVEVPDHYREHVAEKLARLERYDRKVIRFDVELFHEPNPRQSKKCQRVEITATGRGPVIRAEACAADFYSALDTAINKLESRMRKAHDRRVHRGRRNGFSAAEATAPAAAALAGGAAKGGSPVLTAETAVLTEQRTEVRSEPVTEVPDLPWQRWDDEEGYQPGRVVREKEHPAKPMSVDQALYEMELVGHDFYLFNDADTGCPSVVYRRRGFDYGLIRLV
ncbi:MAG TPA: ribosome-associated translation inhibitor RaiA [Pseudonocardiaceae bacterium]